eukprot:gene11490-4654_t
MVDQSVDSKNLFIKYLPPDLTDDNFKDLFLNFGTVLSCKIVRDENFVSKGYGFVRYKNEMEANNALNSMNGYKIGNKILLCTFANLKTKLKTKSVMQEQEEIKEKIKEEDIEDTSSSILSSDHANLFVFHLPPDLDDIALFKLFQRFGKVESVKVCTNEKGESKGYGFVKFSSLQSAINAISTCNGMKIGNKHLKVSFKTQ